VTSDALNPLVADLAATLRACVGAAPESDVVGAAAQAVARLQSECGVDDETRVGGSARYREALEAAYRQADLGERRAAVEAAVVRRLVPGLSASLDAAE
jgi:hypothetical protein